MLSRWDYCCWGTTLPGLPESRSYPGRLLHRVRIWLLPGRRHSSPGSVQLRLSRLHVQGEHAWNRSHKIFNSNLFNAMSVPVFILHAPTVYHVCVIGSFMGSIDCPILGHHLWLLPGWTDTSGRSTRRGMPCILHLWTDGIRLLSWWRKSSKRLQRRRVWGFYATTLHEHDLWLL